MLKYFGLYFLLFLIIHELNGSIIIQNFQNPIENNQNLKDSLELTFSINNKDYNKIGFLKVKDDESIGIKSICLFDSLVYLTDAFHSTIKKVNLNNGKLISSKPLNEKRAWLRDAVVFNKELFVLSDLEDNYILSLDLAIIKQFKLPKNPKYVYKIYQDSLLVFCMGEIITLNQKGDIVNKRSEDVDVLKMAHGKKYQIFKNFIRTEFGTVKLDFEYPYTWKDFYDAINIDFDKKRLVFFQLNPNWFKIFSKTYDK